MSDTLPASKSAAHRIGLCPCPSCNRSGLHAGDVTGKCAWCWNQDIGEYVRFVPVDVAIRYAVEHGEDASSVDTPLEIPEKK